MFVKPLIPHKVRLTIFEIVLILVAFLIFRQLFDIQIIHSQGLISKAKKQFYKPVVLLRGDIRDRNGNLLVLDVITYDVYNNVRDLKKINEEKINKIAQVLGINHLDLKKELAKSINTKIFSKITEEKASEIQKLNPGFIYLSPNVIRTYPHKRLASQIIGFVNSDHKGQHGIEYFHEALLTKITENKDESRPFLKGNDIVLTLDSILQQYTEEELNKAVQRAKASKGTVIVMSPKTGEIYAWAVYPNYDPNLFFKEKAIKNWSITDIYEPGSTFKIITISSALENMTINKDATYYDPGILQVGKRIIRNHDKHKPRQINLLQLLKHSSNVGAAQIGLTMKPRQFYNTIKKFMIGQKTKIDLLGESEGLLLPHKNWKTLDLATTAFGQGAVSLTPLQLASAVSIIANHGIWVQPHVLKGIWEPNYNLINESPFHVISQEAISDDTAIFVSSLLKQNVQENVKAMLYIAGNVPGYEVAGKTGTAQKINLNGKGYLPGHTIASFIGYLPADDPEILTLVVIDDPKTEGGWGNTVAGPVFNNVSKLAAKRILENL